MVTYGEKDFRIWADERGFNDDDLKLIKSTAAKRALLWLLIPQSICLLSLIPGQESWSFIGQAIFFIFFNSFFVHAWTMYKCIKQGTFDNVKSGIILKVFTFLMVISYITIIPLILKIFIKKGYGSGINGLIKKGKVGNH
ncbi:MAG: hypothetical protein ACI4VI_04300 [Acutalibacteraceae bacterium]